MNNSNEIFAVILVVLSPFWAYPMLRMLQACLIEKSMDTRLGVIALGAHFLAVAALWHAGEYGFLLLYLSVTAFLWLISPIFGNLHEYASLRRMQKDDMERYQKILAADPRNGAAHSALGDIYLAREQYDDAIASFERAIAISPDYTRREQSRLLQAKQLRDERQNGRRRIQPPVVEPTQAVNTPVIPETQTPAPGKEAPALAQKQEEPAGEQDGIEVARWFDSLEEEG